MDFDSQLDRTFSTFNREVNSWVIGRGQLESKKVKHSGIRRAQQVNEANRARRASRKKGRFMAVEVERAADLTNRSRKSGSLFSFRGMRTDDGFDVGLAHARWN